MEYATKEFGRLIVKLRRAKRWNQEELAHQCDIGRNALSNIERGKSLPSLETLVIMALKLDLTFPQLAELMVKHGTIEEILNKAKASKKPFLR